MNDEQEKIKIALILPAYNEELSICDTIIDFHNHYPDIYILVVNNASDDKTGEIAQKLLVEKGINGHVIFEGRRGKGRALKTGFRKVEADVYVVVDADNTYFAKDLKVLVDPIINKSADIVIGDRLSLGVYKKENKRKLHNFGNNLVCLLAGILYKQNIKDVMSGYRAMSKRYVKLLPLLSDGFEVETEIMLHTLEYQFNYIEIPIDYKDRKKGSFSKLNTIRDGSKILLMIFNIFRHYKPLYFFSIISLFIGFTSLILGSVVINEYLKTGYIYHIPTAILSSGLGILSALVFLFGLMMDAIRRSFKLNFELIENEYQNK
jgi:glycosyltransferase involved in cell wall biosynthesis